MTPIGLRIAIFKKFSFFKYCHNFNNLAYQAFRSCLYVGSFLRGLSTHRNNNASYFNPVTEHYGAKCILQLNLLGRRHILDAKLSQYPRDLFSPVIFPSFRCVKFSSKIILDLGFFRSHSTAYLLPSENCNRYFSLHSSG